MADENAFVISTPFPSNISIADNESYTERIAFAAIFILISITGIIGNLLVILAIILSRKLRSTTNWFVLNLACVDLLTCILLIFYVVAILSGNVLVYTGWLLAFAYSITLTSMLSLTTHALIGFTSWYLITKNLTKSKKLFKALNICIMIAFSWLLTIIFCAMLFLTGTRSEYAAQFIIGLWIIGHFAVILTVYIKICRFVAQQENKMATTRGFAAKGLSETEMSSRACGKSVASVTGITDDSLEPASPSQERLPTDECGQSSSTSTSPAEVSSRKEKLEIQHTLETQTKPNIRSKTKLEKQTDIQLNRKMITLTKNLLVILIAFVICFIPYSICLYIPNSSAVEHWLLVLLFFNSCINPIIYARRIRVFREVMGCIIRCQLGSIPMPIPCLRRITQTN